MSHRSRMQTVPVLVVTCLVACLTATSTATAAPSALEERQAIAPADHLSGDFSACAIVVEFTPPSESTPGSLILDGVATVEPHPFEILPGTYIVDPDVIAYLADGDRLGCFYLRADQQGRLDIVSYIAADEHEYRPLRSCGTVSLDVDTYVVTDVETGVPIRLVTLEPEQAPLLDAFVSGAYAGRVACVYFVYSEANSVDRVSGPVLCGSVADANPDPDLAVLVVDGDTIGSVPAVEVDGLEAPAPAGLRSLALLEWANKVQSDPAFAGTASVCFHDDVYGNVRICGSLQRDGDVGWLEAGQSRAFYARSFLTTGVAIDQTLAVSAGAWTCLRLLGREFYDPRYFGAHFSSVTLDACLVVGEDGRFTTLDGTAHADLGPYIWEMDPTLRPGDIAGIRIYAEDSPDASDRTIVTRVPIEGCEEGAAAAPTPGSGTGRPTVTPPATDVGPASSPTVGSHGETTVIVLAVLSAFAILSARRGGRRAR